MISQYVASVSRVALLSLLVLASGCAMQTATSSGPRYEAQARQRTSRAQLAETLNRPGELPGERRATERAAPHLEQAFRVYEAALGPEHSWTARARGNLGMAYHGIGRNDEALALLEKSYADLLAQDLLGGFPSRRIVDGLAALYRDMGRPELAEQLAQGEG